MLEYIDYVNIIKKMSNKDSNYNWNNGNNFLGKNGIRKTKLRPLGLDKKIAKENLLILKKIFDKYKLEFFLIDGTLLGAIRDKDFIYDDNDTDICINYSDLELLVKCVPDLIEQGLEPLRISNNEISFMKNNEYIDIEFLKEKTRFTENLDIIEFCGESFNIPSNVNEYLTICYGNWREKSDKHNWTVPT